MGANYFGTKGSLWRIKGGAAKNRREKTQGDKANL